MGSQGPGDIPRVVRRRAARARRKPQPPSSTARQNAAYGSRPARPLPRPVARPKPAAPVQPRGDTKADIHPRGTQVKPLAAKPPRTTRAGKPVRTQRQVNTLVDRVNQQSAAAVNDRARAIAAVSRSGGEFPTFAHGAEREAAVEAAKVRQSQRRASAVAPALKVLDQVTRPIHGIAAAEVSDVKRGGVKELFAVHAPGSKAAKERRQSFKRGVQLKDRSLSSDVLKAAGVKNKGVAAAGGFVLDVLQDPTTFVTGGKGAVAERVGAKVAARVSRKVVAQGVRAAKEAPTAAQKVERLAVSRESAQRLGEAAGKRAAAKAPAGRGITIKYAGHEIPGVRRGTAAVARKTGAAVRKVAPVAARTVPKRARNLAREFAPRVRPSDVTEEQFFAARGAARKARTRVTTQTQKAMTLAESLKRTLPADDYAKVIDAIERNDLSRLPSKKLAVAAHELRSELKGARRASRRAGVAAGHQVGDTSRFVTKADEKRLANSVAAEQRAQKRAISRSVTKEQASRERALVTEAVGSATGRRAGQAAIRYERRASTTHLNTQKLKAAQNIPVRGKGEGHAAHLRRVVAHAKQHDLPIVAGRAEKLLQGAPTDIARGYFPREYDERILKKLGVTKEDVGPRMARAGVAPAKVVQTTAGHARSEQRRLADVNAELRAAGQPTHSENIPLVVVNHMREAARATSGGEFAKEMAKAGRAVKHGDELAPGEQVYKLGYRGKQFGLHPVKEIPKTGRGGGQFVALNRHLVDAMKGQAVPAQARGEATHIWDAATGGFKRVATATLGFHVRNAIGDTSQHYLASPGQRIPGNIAAATKATRRASEQARTVIPSRTEATVRVAGKHEPIDEFLKGARENGVLDAGYIGRELHDLGAQATGQMRVKSGPLHRAGATLNRWMTNRENLMRIATYKAGLDQGMSKEAAADLANHIHVDYGELSDIERKVMRRIFPFYTWTARQLPVQVGALVTKPGKFATLEKAREETASGFGLNEEAARRGMTPATSRQVPFVIKIGKGAQGVSASLPATLLNELPLGASPKELNAWLDEVGRFSFGMVSPFIRSGPELYLNRVFATKQDIENQRRGILVAAPSWVQALPPWAKRDLHVTPNFVDKRTGKKVWGWRGRADWGYHQIPGAPSQVSTLASGGRPGQPKDVGAAVAGFAGIRADSLNAQAVKRTKDIAIFKRLAKLNARASELNQQGITSDNATPEYKHLRAQINALTKQVRPPKKRKARTGPLPLGGGSGGKLPLGGGAGGKLPLGGG